MLSKTPSAVTIVPKFVAIPASNPACLPIDEFLIYACDFSLAILSGVAFALFNLLIGRYVTVSVSHNGHPDRFEHFQCIIHFVCAGTALTLLAFLHHISLNTENPAIQHKLSPVYRRTLGIFVRDLSFLVASISIAFNRSWALTVPILLVPILVTAWTTLLQKQRPPIVRGLFLAGPLCFFFLNISLGGLYGTELVDLGQIDQPGIIFTIVVGIGSSAVQFAKARAQFKPFLPHHAPQLYVHDENLDKPEYEKNPIEDYVAENGDAQATNNSNGNYEKNVSSIMAPAAGFNELDRQKKKHRFWQIIQNWLAIQLFMLKSWPACFIIGLFACLAHAFGYPVFTRLTGLFFSVFEEKLGATDSLVNHVQVQWICLAYGTMGIIVFVAITSWNGIFGKMGIKLCEKLERNLESKDIDLVKKVDWKLIEMIPLLSTEFFYGLFCMIISISSCLQNNRPMGLWAVAVFSTQVFIQHFVCHYLNKSKYGRAVGFASTNGMQQASQAITYAGGFILVQQGLTSALNVFKIIQTMHLGSMGLTSVVLLANDFERGSQELEMAMTTKNNGGGNGRRIVPIVDNNGNATP